MKNEKTTTGLLEFAKNYWWLLAILVLLPIIGVLVYCIVFQKEICNAGAWASLIAGVSTYLGTVTLSIFTFYFSWQQQKIQAAMQEAKFSLNLYATHNNDYFVPYSEDELAPNENLSHKSERFEHSTAQGQDIKEWNFLGFAIKNINHLVNFKVEFEGVFFVNKEHKLQEIKNRVKIWASEHDDSPVDYKQTYTCFIGCDAKLLSRKYMERQKYSNWFIVFSVTDDNSIVKHVICDYVLGQTFGVSKSIISDEEYHKRIKAHGTPVSLTWYNKQFFN